jgi:hypothetical protein
MKLKQTTIFGLPASPLLPPQQPTKRQNFWEKKRQRKELEAQDIEGQPQKMSCRGWRESWFEEFRWLIKVPVVCPKTGNTTYLASCSVCKEANMRSGIGAHPTSVLKKCNWETHEASGPHEEVRG